MDSVHPLAKLNSANNQEFAAQNSLALAWVVDAVLDGDVNTTAQMFALPVEAQFLAMQLLRTAARAAIATSGIDVNEFLSVLCHAWARRMVPAQSVHAE
jgi:cytochrome c5